MSAALVLTFARLLPALAGQTALEPSVVKLERLAQGELWTVRAREASARALLARVTELSGLEVDATTALDDTALVTVELDRRPLQQVLEFALGSAGLLAELSGTTIHVRADRPEATTLEQRARLAAGAWERAARLHPRHAEAATARLARGELAELAGRDETARQRYLELQASSPLSPAACEAQLRAGRLAAERGDWSEASEQFRALANLPGADEYRAVARVELARATAGLGDAASALYILDQLDAAHPCHEPSERTARILTRVEALLAGGRASEALDCIEQHAGRLDPLGARAAPRLRARALEGSGLAAEASGAWLLVAREAAGAGRIQAYREAARLAEEAHDPLAVLFACHEARAAGLGTYLAEEERRAEQALGVAASEPTDGAEQRLQRAEQWLVLGRTSQARTELAELQRERESLALAPLERARLALAWTRCLVLDGLEGDGLESAARSARTERERLDSGEARVFLDRGMARLFEEHELFERAADAAIGDY